MKLGFINIGRRLAQFFMGCASCFPVHWELGFYSSGKPKVRSLIVQSGFTSYGEDHSHRASAAYSPDRSAITWIGRKPLQLGVPVEKVDEEINRLLPGMQGFFRDFEPDVIFVWNGSGLVASLAEHLARQRGIGVLYGENGYLPYTMQLDREGVNFDSSITRRLPYDLERVALSEADGAATQAFLTRFRLGDFPPYAPRKRVPKPSSWSRIEDAVINWKPLHLPRRLNRGIPQSATLPERYVFLPLQVAHDSQLLFHSPLVGQDLPRLLRETSKSLRQIAKHHRLVVKLHPEDLGKTDYEAISRQIPDILFVQGMDVRKLIAGADAVVTINSTVGFEAILMEKPVVAVGRNFYTIRPLTIPVTDYRQMAPALEEALSVHHDAGIVHRLVHLARHRYFAAGSWKDHSPRSYEPVARRLVEEANATQRNPQVLDRVDSNSRQYSA